MARKPYGVLVGENDTYTIYRFDRSANYYVGKKGTHRGEVVYCINMMSLDGKEKYIVFSEAFKNKIEFKVIEDVEKFVEQMFEK